MSNLEQSYLKVFDEEKLKKYHLTKDDQQKIVALVNEGIEKHLYTDTKDFQHDLKHIEKVLSYIQMMLNEMPNREVDEKTLLLAGLYHDIGKTIGASGKEHGKVGAEEFIKRIENKIDVKEALKISLLICQHASEEDKIEFANTPFSLEEQKEIQKMSDILKDADALDRNRLNYPAPLGGCDINKLRTEEGKKIYSLTNDFYMDYNLAIIHERERKKQTKILNNYELLGKWLLEWYKGDINMFHASLDPSIEILLPNESTQKGSYVYAGKDPIDCFSMACFRSSAIFPRCTINQKKGIKEIFPDSIKNTLEAKYITIYHLPNEEFHEYKKDVTSSPSGEWVSENAVKPLSQVSFKALDLLKYFEHLGFMNIIQDHSFESQLSSFLKATEMYIWGIKSYRSDPSVMDKKWLTFSKTIQYYFKNENVLNLFNMVKKDIDNEITTYIEEFKNTNKREPDFDNEKECLKPLISIYRQKYFVYDDLNRQKVNYDHLNELCIQNEFPFKIVDGNLQEQDILKRTNKISGYINDISIIFLTIFMGILIGLIFMIKG